MQLFCFHYNVICTSYTILYRVSHVYTMSLVVAIHNSLPTENLIIRLVLEMMLVAVHSYVPESKGVGLMTNILLSDWTMLTASGKFKYNMPGGKDEN